MHILILHGIMGHAGENWGQWLHNELVTKGHSVTMPNLPRADHPDRKEWLRVVTGLADDKKDLVIIGHSLGVTTALDYIEQTKIPVDGLVSVSGFAKPYGLELNDYFLKEKSVNFKKIKDNLNYAAVFYGDDDPYVPQDILLELANNLKVQPVIFNGGGHLNEAAGYKKFPELLDAVLKMIAL